MRARNSARECSRFFLCAHRELRRDCVNANARMLYSYIYTHMSSSHQVYYKYGTQCRAFVPLSVASEGAIVMSLKMCVMCVGFRVGGARNANKHTQRLCYARRRRRFISIANMHKSLYIYNYEPVPTKRTDRRYTHTRTALATSYHSHANTLCSDCDYLAPDAIKLYYTRSRRRSSEQTCGDEARRRARKY